jgi:hypothetical protein
MSASEFLKERPHVSLAALKLIPDEVETIHSAPPSSVRPSSPRSARIIRFDGDKVYAAREIFSSFAANMILERVKLLPFETDEKKFLSRVTIGDDKLAANLWRMIEKYLPQDLSFIDHSQFFSKRGGSEWKKVGAVPVIDAVKHEAGVITSPLLHDCYFKRFVIKEDDKRYQQQSFMVCSMYLNSEGIDFDGGATSYLINGDDLVKSSATTKPSSERSSDESAKSSTTDETAEDDAKSAETSESLHVISHAEKGSMFAATYDTPYRISSVTKGTKYVVRVHVLYEREIVVDPAIKARMISLDKWKPGSGQWQLLPL